ncbi:unnamed protein product [Dovyalis caffra]|uniref:Uncharacterized protein n=1 Tax=Dovyalis caffra TaxID=77055 RepID=A0AAV1RB75_9ROSI|nr:unnamed protein product [Dovyalis caffra]
MYIDCHLPQVPDDEELQLGQLYFLMPLSQSNVPLSLQQLGALACKASASLAHLDLGFTSEKTLPYLDRNDTQILATDQRRCKIPVSFDIIGSNFLARRTNPRIGLMLSHAKLIHGICGRDACGSLRFA